MCITLLWIFLAVLSIAYFYYKKIYGYWERRGIPSASGAIPGFGHTLQILTLQKNLSIVCIEMQEKYPNCSMIGFYDGFTPALLVCEPELAKIVMQTNFSHFQENLFKVDHERDPLLALNPFFAKGDTWFTSRKRLSYAFSSMRLRMLTESVQQVCTKFDNFLKKQLEKNSTVEYELEDLFTMFTGEIVASAALGIEGFCFDEENNSNSMRKLAKRVFEPTLWNNISQQINFMWPKLAKICNLNVLSKDMERDMRNLVTEILEQRKNDTTRKNDFFQLMADMEKTQGEKINVDALTAYILSFVLDGYETSAITLHYIGYDLAQNPHIQDKLREEICTVLARHNDTITYEALKEMRYMEQVISESQRTHTLLRVMTKVCTEAIDLEGSDGIRCRVEPGTEIMIPLVDFQENPKYWNNPEIFDPDRFSEENKANIRQYTFLPFGEGPRMCVGMRMALVQMKACLATLLKNYKLRLSPKTKVPLELDIGNIFLRTKSGIWVYIERL